MKERGKSVKTHSKFSDFNSQIPCNKHPNSSSVGVCAYCLNDKLVRLISSDISSSYRSSISTMDFDSVEKVNLRRSNSSCVEAKKRNGFWRIKGLFGKRKVKGCENNFGFSEDQSEIWVSDKIGVSRSWSFSTAKISGVTNGVLFDSDKFCGLNQMEVDRVYKNYYVPKRSAFPVKESDFSVMDESAFIDLKLDLLKK